MDGLSLLQGIFPTQGIELRSPAFQVDSLPAEPQGKSKDIRVGSLSLLQGIFPSPGIEPGSPALQVDSLPTELSRKPDYLPTECIREYIFFLALKEEKHSKSIGHMIRGRKMILFDGIDLLGSWAFKETTHQFSEDQSLLSAYRASE